MQLANMHDLRMQLIGEGLDEVAPGDKFWKLWFRDKLPRKGYFALTLIRIPCPHPPHPPLLTLTLTCSILVY